MEFADRQKTADELARALNEIRAAMDRKASLESGVHTYVIGANRSKLQVSRTAFSGKVEAFVVVEEGDTNTTYRPGGGGFVDKVELKEWAMDQFGVDDVEPSADALLVDNSRAKRKAVLATSASSKAAKSSPPASDNGGRDRRRTTKQGAGDSVESKLHDEVESILATLDERIDQLELLSDTETLKMSWWSTEYDRIKNANPNKNEKEISFMMRTAAMPDDGHLLEAAQAPTLRLRRMKNELLAAAEAASAAQALLCARATEVKEALCGAGSAPAV